LLQNVEQNKLFLGGCDEQMLIVKLDIRYSSVIGVYLVVAYVCASDIDHPDFCLGSDNDVILDEVHPHDLLTVDVESKQLLFVVNAHAYHVALHIPEG
jgi:hypothetical protein